MCTLALPDSEEMYSALLRRDERYEGIFVVGVTTTGIFCRPSCPARKPKAGNVEYFERAQQALRRGYRPCKRCRPLEPLGAAPEWLAGLLRAVEADPQRRWRDADLREAGLEPSRVRRWFQRHHGMTFHAYSRARRLGTALGAMRRGVGAPPHRGLLAAGMDSGWSSESGFRRAFAEYFGEPPGALAGVPGEVVRPLLMVRRLETPLGPMLATASEAHLYLLEFVDRRMLSTQIDRLRARLDGCFVPGDNAVLRQIQAELSEYFGGTRRTFDVPTQMPGTEFQRAVWAALQQVPFGETRSYAAQAEAIGRPRAVRAVGRANGDNRLAIVVPCHRVVGADGALTGYGGGLWRKRALLALEGATL